MLNSCTHSKSSHHKLNLSDEIVRMFGKDLQAYAVESGIIEESRETKYGMPSSLEEFQEQVMNIGAKWRNGCVNNEEFQNKLRDGGILMYCLLILKSYFEHDEEWEEYDSRKTVLILLQVVANAMTANKPIQIYLYEICDHILFKEILPKALTKGKNMTNIACMSIYNSIAKGNLQLEGEFFTNKQLMLDLLDNLYETKQTKEWIFLIYKKYFLSKAYMTEADEPFFFEEEEYFSKLFDTVNENNTLLNLLEIMDHFCSEETQATEPARASETYKHLLMFCVNLISRFEDKFHPSTTNTLHMFTFTQFECLFVCLECMASLSGLINLSKEKSLQVDLRKECTRWCLKIFNQTGLLVMTRESDHSVDNQPNEYEEDQMYMGYKSLLVRALANLTYATREIQDYIREEQGIPLILSCCAVQDPNPFLREWGVFCVRNLCENNEENVKFISGVKLESLDESTEELLAKQGFKATIENGKIKLQKIVLPHESSSQEGESNTSDNAIYENDQHE
ncbi:hypothetical protein C9374_006347 [Naegleria lovaniensis]|uniref:Ataxin-10 domain-containing protein n=1 Tax=Naegleria lovaniensis TaxID=51637 RepID=A0AA88GNM9_NAELO|nr:uncharacterized protein C9374_006347 [Naegleria lovaniensis]KAG2381358.1 hypothetical protein C9374_006347 [Naegleria lovaniensis]